MLGNPSIARRKTALQSSPAAPGEFPHVVEIQYLGIHLCSGSLLNEEWVLTSAVCTLQSIEGYQVIAGQFDLDQNEEYEQIRTVSQAIKHPDFD